jgi:hypothetical protein
MSFRQYGGTNYAARNNIVKNNYTNANNLSIMKQIGQPVSAISLQSGLNLVNNIVFQQLNGPVYGIKYSDGTFQTTSKTTTDTYWQPQDDSATPPIYYTNKVAIGPDPSTIDSNLQLAINGSIGTNGIIYSGYTTDSKSFINTLKLDNTTGSIDMSGNLTLNGANPTIKSTSVSSDLIIKSGSGKGINLQTNGTSTNVLKLASDGSATFNSSVLATSFITLSDYRIKENVVNLDSNFTVDNLRPVTYTNIITGKQDIGLIAHELQEHYPCLVMGKKDGDYNQHVNYTGLIGILIKEIKELKEEIKELKNNKI